MSVYLLTHAEAWMLCTLLHLPVQPGSAMAGWLNSAKPAVSPATLDESMSGLQEKGYYDPTKAEQPFLDDFLASLALACMNAAELTALIRRNGQANLTRFAQVGGGLVQFGMDETNLTLQDVQKMDEVAGALLPDWFTVSQAEDLRAELPLGAFLLFKQAGIQADLALADSGFQEAAFKKSRLLEQFKVDQGWVNIFSAEGVRGMLPVDQMPLEDYFNQLCARGYLEGSGPDVLRIGEEGRPLADALADPDQCTLTVAMVAWEGGFPQSGVFLYGSGRLFLAELKPGLIIIQQFPSLEKGQAWVKKLLVKGSQARYASYSIPPTPKPQPVQPTPVLTEAAESVQPAPPASILAELAGEATRLKPYYWLLDIETGLLKGQRFPLGERLKIGRALDNDLVLTDTQVSRKHAVIERTGQEYQVSDLGSGNGTLVNGVLIIKPTELKSGDVLQVGETRITVVGPEMPTSPEPLPLEEPTQRRPAPQATQAHIRAAAMPTQVTPASPQSAATPVKTNPVQQLVRVCPHCGASLKPTSKFCPGCGKPVEPGTLGIQQ